ncbi:MAG: hypothetical protein M3Y84_04110 [Acidobacteriota bacterium]|nr:hypothetical protein [Acidobacteriota bacterium]
MSAIETLYSSRDSLPVCLWKENSSRLVSLWDMLRVLARDFVAVIQNLRLLEEKLLSRGLGAYDSREVGTILGQLEHECLALELSSARKQIQRIFGRFNESLSLPEDQGPTNAEMITLLSELRRRVEEDLEDGVLFWVESSKVRAFFTNVDDDDGQTMIVLKSPEELLSPEVITKFPNAVSEYKEAVKCFVSDRSTGCVFHLMRCLECGLAILGKVFGVSLEHTNWGTAIDQIESRIREMHKDPQWKAQPDCKGQQEFYAQAASHFGVLKDAWRNYTALHGATTIKKTL